MENEKSTNEAQELTLEQLEEATGGAAGFTLAARTPVAQRLVPRLPHTISLPIGNLRDPGAVFIPARPRLLDSLPGDLISLVEKL